MRAVDINLFYLSEHDFCDIKMIEQMGGHFIWGFARITSAGLDFIAADGGLSAILNTVTVRFEASTIRELIAAKIEGAALPQQEKSFLKEQLRALSGSALRLAASDLMKRGLDHLPEALEWIKSLHGA